QRPRDAAALARVSRQGVRFRALVDLVSRACRATTGPHDRRIRSSRLKTPSAASASAVNTRPPVVSAGAAGLPRLDVPRLLGALQVNCGWSQAVSQHTPSTQKVDEH